MRTDEHNVYTVDALGRRFRRDRKAGVGTHPKVGTQEPAAVGVATVVTVLCVLPVFLTGGMAVQISLEFGPSAQALGIAMATFIAVQALLSGPLGRLADRLPAMRAMRLSLAITAASCLGLAVAAESWLGLAVALGAAGVGNALGQPAASRHLASIVRVERQGIAFGVFQSSKPLAGLLSGLAVPAVALSVGWRWAFVGVAVIALALAGARAGPQAPAPAAVAQGADRRLLASPAMGALLVGVAGGFGAVKIFSSFLVDASVQAGMGEATAGLVLSVASVVAVVARLTVGLFADRWAGSLWPLVVVMLLVGAGGFALIAVDRPLLMAPGAVIVGVGAWGYNGLLHLSMVRTLSHRPATITGLLLAGASTGGVVGPVVFGAVVERSSYPIGWMGVTSLVLLAAALLGLGGRRVDQQRGRASTVGPE